MKDVRKSIQHARPKLRLVSPLAYWIIFILGFFNIALGGSFLFTLDRFTNSLLIVNDVFTFQMWGLVFIGLGILKLYSLWANKWSLARTTLLIGVTVKAAWAIALIVRLFVSPATLFAAFIWISLALIQTVTYIFFMPPATPPVLPAREAEDA